MTDTGTTPDGPDPAVAAPDAPQDQAPEAISRRTLWIGGVIVTALLGLGVWLLVVTLPRLLTTPSDSADATPSAASASDTRKIKATVFYISEHGAELIAATREVLYAAAPADQMRRILEAQMAAPPEGRRSPMPPGTTVRDVYLTPGEAYVDLGGSIVTAHSGGSLDEALTVYAIVNAVTVNMPTISAVQILIEGKQVDTLVGHLDLRYPLPKAPEWVQKGS